MLSFEAVVGAFLGIVRCNVHVEFKRGKRGWVGSVRIELGWVVIWRKKKAAGQRKWVGYLS